LPQCAGTESGGRGMLWTGRMTLVSLTLGLFCSHSKI
jgi:hypothetical protein